MGDDRRAGAEGSWCEALFHQAWLPMARVDPRGRIVDGNAALGRLLGRGLPELRGLSGRCVVAPGAGLALAEQWRELLAGRRSRCRGRVLVVRTDQRLVCVDVVAWAVRTGDRRPGQVLCSLNPVRGVDGEHGASGDVAELLQVPSGIRLSGPEARALEGVAEGLDNAALGARLYLSRTGVDYYLGRLRRKFRVQSRCGLVARAYALGVLVGAVWPPRVDSAYVEAPSEDA
ncbi:PAS domain-containing protein [Catenulispora subtropica]|uniref:HTH luxR-type domain-containing protein n=1 Tax=Catenulispora subtropica TaxID=450798 RepID=A0ABP5C911_9ACTN